MTANREALSDAIRWAREQEKGARKLDLVLTARHYDTLAEAAEHELARLPAPIICKEPVSPAPGAVTMVQEASMAVDRKALEKSIDDLRRWPFNSGLTRVLAAAEAHLASLPRTKIVYEVCATDAGSNVYDEVDHALSTAEHHLKEGRTVVLSRLEIPAGQT